MRGSPCPRPACGYHSSLAGCPISGCSRPVQPAPVPPAPGAPVPQPASQGSSVLVKVLVGFLIFILLIVLAVMGSCVYIGYRAKKKADEIQQAYKSNNLNKLAGALGVESQRALRVPMDRQEAAVRPIRRRFLFRPGHLPPGENSGHNSPAPRPDGSDCDRPVWRRLRVHQANSEYPRSACTFRTAPTASPILWKGCRNQQGPGSEIQRVCLASRTVRAEDLQTAHDYMQEFGQNQPEVMPGTTAISVSREVLAELKRRAKPSSGSGPEV